MNPRKLKRKLVGYIKFKELARAIKLVALSQLNFLKKKISSRALPLSSIVPFFDKNNNINFESNKLLVVPIGIDKSRCGPHNSNVFRKAEKVIDNFLDNNKTVKIYTIGVRTKDYFMKYYPELIIGHIYNTDKEPLSLTASFIIAEKLLHKIYDRMYFIFNRYYSPFLQKLTMYEVIGINHFYQIALNAKFSRKMYMHEDFYNFLYKFDTGTLKGALNDIYYHSFAMVLLDVLEENEYSSLGARVTAMDNSGTNAESAIIRMTLLYNKARQASITNESIEIISAANLLI